MKCLHNPFVVQVQWEPQQVLYFSSAFLSESSLWTISTSKVQTKCPHWNYLHKNLYHPIEKHLYVKSRFSCLKTAVVFWEGSSNTREGMSRAKFLERKIKRNWDKNWIDECISKDLGATDSSFLPNFFLLLSPCVNVLQKWGCLLPTMSICSFSLEEKIPNSFWGIYTSITFSIYKAT